MFRPSNSIKRIFGAFCLSFGLFSSAYNPIRRGRFTEARGAADPLRASYFLEQPDAPGQTSGPTSNGHIFFRRSEAGPLRSMTPGRPRATSARPFRPERAQRQDDPVVPVDHVFDEVPSGREHAFRMRRARKSTERRLPQASWADQSIAKTAEHIMPEGAKAPDKYKPASGRLRARNRPQMAANGDEISATPSRASMENAAMPVPVSSPSDDGASREAVSSSPRIASSDSDEPAESLLSQEKEARGGLLKEALTAEEELQRKLSQLSLYQQQDRDRENLSAREEQEREKYLQLNSSLLKQLHLTTKRLENLEKSIVDEKTCGICFVNKINAVFIPCGHVGACLECALKIKPDGPTYADCPFCRKTINAVNQVFFPNSLEESTSGAGSTE